MADVKEEYIRVGTSLYKLAHQPLANGTTVLRRIPWSLGQSVKTMAKATLRLSKI